MKLVSEPAIADKIHKMQQRVRWQDPVILERGVDQTRFMLADNQPEQSEFSFLVVGDSGSGSHRGHNPQRQVAEMMLPHHQECSFMLHTGDVIYLVGSSEYYRQNFITPYREFLVGGEDYRNIAYEKMRFKLPILPVLGNHDYYDLPLLINFVALTTLPLRRLLKSKLDLDIGRHGSRTGEAYAKAFLDYLQRFKFPGDLQRHLDSHYTAKTETGYCLKYQPGEFTRLPNRYYTFRYRGVDFFALDSNTFNEPLPLPDTQAGAAQREKLNLQRRQLEQEKLTLMEKLAQLAPEISRESESHDDLHNQISQIEEIIVDIDKQLDTNPNPETDTEQLQWLQDRLIDSWNNPEVRGRILYFHHPPYVTEATKWQQGQTLAVRDRLRRVFDAVAAQTDSSRNGRSVVDLVLNGHAHCFEHLQTLNTGHADSGIDWIVCGGSGFSLRRQRQEGTDLYELDPIRTNANPEIYTGDFYTSKLNASNSDTDKFDTGTGELERDKIIARSHLFIGRNGHGSHKRRPYSFVRIDVKDGSPLQLIVRPFIVERYQRQWFNYEIKSFVVGNGKHLNGFNP